MQLEFAIPRALSKRIEISGGKSNKRLNVNYTKCPEPGKGNTLPEPI